MVVFASESITSWLSLPPHPPPPAHVALAAVFQVRDGALCVLLWERAREPFSRRVGAARRDARRATRRSRARSCGTSRRRSTCARSRTSSSSGPGATRRAIPSAGSSRPPTSGSSRSGSTRACRPTRAGTRSTRCPRRRSTTARSSSRVATASAASSRTRTSASRSRPATFTLAELRDVYEAALGYEVSATNLKRVLVRRGAIEAVGKRRAHGPAGGRPAELYRFRDAPARGDGSVRGAAPARVAHPWIDWRQLDAQCQAAVKLLHRLKHRINTADQGHAALSDLASRDRAREPRRRGGRGCSRVLARRLAARRSGS